MPARILGLLITAAAMAAPLSGAISVAPAAARLRVAAPPPALAALAAAGGGELVSVESIVPPVTDPEAFEPRPGDTDKVRRAALLVRVGLGYDYWLDALTQNIGDKRLMRGGDAYLDASGGIPLLEIRGQSVTNEGGHSHGVANPHYWLDSEYVVIFTAGIAEALVRLVPEQRERIVANRIRFLAELTMRRKRWSDRLAPFAGVKLIAYHNSWPYFARRFRLDVIDFVEPRPGVAPSPAHLARLISEGRRAQVRAILHEPYEPEDASRLVARKLEVPLVLLAVSVDSVPGTKDYFALIEYNVAALAGALSPRGRQVP